MIEKYKDDGWFIIIVRMLIFYGFWQFLLMCYFKNIVGYEEVFDIMEGMDFIIYIEDVVSVFRCCKIVVYLYEVIYLVEEKLQFWSVGVNIIYMEVKEEVV